MQVASSTGDRPGVRNTFLFARGAIRRSGYYQREHIERGETAQEAAVEESARNRARSRKDAYRRLGFALRQLRKDPKRTDPYAEDAYRLAVLGLGKHLVVWMNYRRSRIPIDVNAAQVDDSGLLIREARAQPLGCELQR